MFVGVLCCLVWLMFFDRFVFDSFGWFGFKLLILLDVPLGWLITFGCLVVDVVACCGFCWFGDVIGVLFCCTMGVLACVLFCCLLYVWFLFIG